MCGIIGVFNRDGASLQVKQGLTIMDKRGMDSYSLASSKTMVHSKTPNNLPDLPNTSIFGHCLHSLVSFLPQPIKGKGMLISNNEIYNWKKLNQQYNLTAKNDSELILKIIEKFPNKSLALLLFELDGVYAFGYWIKNKVILARDILGIKPLFYSDSPNFAFASESKVLLQLGYNDVKELNPRTILEYNTRTKRIVLKRRPFFKLKNLNLSEVEIKKRLKGLLTNAIAKRIPDQKFGILLSGGVDSTFIALICKQLGLPFICYTAALQEPHLKAAEDIEYAKAFCTKYDLPLKITYLTLEQIHKKLEQVVPLIEDSNVIKVGVALTFYTACEEARKDGIRVMFSGLGSEEIFAGYDRHTRALDINKECLSGLLKMYERDLYRDDVITMNNNIELRLPFLDKQLVTFSLNIPPQLKIANGETKLIFRKVSLELGLPEKYAMRKKRAAQYGSRFDKAIEKLAHKNKFPSKSSYLDTFYKKPNVRLGVLFSSGKDSCYALHTMLRQNYEIAGLITLKSKNPSSYMFHTPNISLASMQAEAMGFPILEQSTAGKKEDELKDLKKALAKAKELYNIRGVVTGALYSTYQRDRIEKVCDSLDLKIFSPLWHINQEEEMRSLLKNNFSFIFSAVQAEGFDKSWVGRPITDSDINSLVKLNKKYGINIAGEGGEFESLVLDAPMFKKKIEILKSEIIVEDNNTVFFVVKKAQLQKKES